jgi:hypothetical protein
MSGGAYWLLLILSLIIFNTTAIKMKNRIPLWLSGILIGVLGVILAFVIGSWLVESDKSTGGDGVGGAFAASFFGLVIVGNGILYFLGGGISEIIRLLKQKSIDQ